MLRATLLAFIFTFISSRSHSQNVFDKYIANTAGIHYYNFYPTSDKGFVLCGEIFNNSDLTYDFYIEKYDSSANYQWNDTFTSLLNYDESCTGIIETFDGHFIFLGTAQNPNDHYDSYYSVYKLDSLHNVDWHIEDPGDICANGEELISTADSGYIVRYQQYSGAGHHSEPILRYTKTDSLLFTRGGGFSGVGHRSTDINSNLHLVSIGTSCDYCISFNYMYQPDVDLYDDIGIPKGDYLFTRDAFSGFPTLNAICSSSDNGALICGTDSLTGDLNVSIIHINSTADSTWTMNYGSANRLERGIDIRTYDDGGYILTGFLSDSCNADNTRIFVMKLDQNYVLTWTKVFNGLNYNSPHKIFQTADKGFMLLGDSWDSTQSYLRIIKMDSLGNTTGPGVYNIASNLSCPVYCIGDTATLSVLPAASSYLWSTGETTSTIKVTNSGSYSVIVTNNLGATFTSAFYPVSFLHSPTVDLGADTTTVCGSVNINSGSNNYSNQYQWFLNDTLIPNAIYRSYNAVVGGKYSLIESNQCGADSDSQFIFINPNPPTPVLQYNNLDFCTGDSLRLWVQDYDSITWYANVGPIATVIYGAVDSFIYITNSDIYYAAFIDTTGCISYSAQITTIEKPVPNTPHISYYYTQAFCELDSFRLWVYNSLPAQWYEYNGSNVSIPGATDSIYYVTHAGIYLVELTGANGCSIFSDTLNITMYNNPVPDLGNDTMVCNDEFVNLNPGPGYSYYQWQDLSTQQNYLATDLGATQNDTLLYYVTVYDSIGCHGSDTIQIVFQICIDVNEIGNENELLFSNPSTGRLKLNFESGTFINSLVSVYDLSGNVIYQKFINGNDTEIDLTSFAAGSYILKINSSGKSYRLVKMN